IEFCDNKYITFCCLVVISYCSTLIATITCFLVWPIFSVPPLPSSRAEKVPAPAEENQTEKTKKPNRRRRTAKRYQ
ncbi:hypothetical protein M5D96_013584, partial [Drosophila gunungcola]